jgi:hypothetical protein
MATSWSDTPLTWVHRGYTYPVTKETWYTYFGTGEDQIIIGWAKKQRTDTVERKEMRGLSKTGAEAVNAEAGWAIVSKTPEGSSEQWVVTEEKTTLGAWIDEPEPEE